MRHPSRAGWERRSNSRQPTPRRLAGQRPFGRGLGHKERLADLGFVTKPMSPAEFTAFVANQVQSFQAPVKASGAKL